MVFEPNRVLCKGGLLLDGAIKIYADLFKEDGPVYPEDYDDQSVSR